MEGNNTSVIYDLIERSLDEGSDIVRYKSNARGSKDQMAIPEEAFYVMGMPTKLEVTSEGLKVLKRYEPEE